MGDSLACQTSLLVGFQFSETMSPKRGQSEWSGLKKKKAGGGQGEFRMDMG